VPKSPAVDATPSAPEVDAMETSDDDELPWATTSHLAARPSQPFVARPRSRRRAPRYATVGAALVVLAIAGFGFGSRVVNDRESAGVTNEDASGDFVSPASSTGPERSAPAAAVVPGARHDSTSVAAAAVTRAEPAVQLADATPKSDASAATPAAPSLPSLRTVAVPKVAMTNLDSMITTSSKAARGREPKFVPAGGALDVSGLGDAGSVTPPALIGPAPTPSFPDALRAHPIEGEVIVQFRVTEKGRADVTSMQVLQSPHELFTEAVRGVLPKFRFEPAHSGAIGAKPQAAWVQFRTRFTAKN
jgi:TonB family protein